MNDQHIKWIGLFIKDQICSKADIFSMEKKHLELKCYEENSNRNKALKIISMKQFLWKCFLSSYVSYYNFVGNVHVALCELLQYAARRTISQVLPSSVANLACFQFIVNLCKKSHRYYSASVICHEQITVFLRTWKRKWKFPLRKNLLRTQSSPFICLCASWITLLMIISVSSCKLTPSYRFFKKWWILV